MFTLTEKNPPLWEWIGVCKNSSWSDMGIYRQLSHCHRARCRRPWLCVDWECLECPSDGSSEPGWLVKKGVGNPNNRDHNHSEKERIYKPKIGDLLIGHCQVKLLFRWSANVCWSSVAHRVVACKWHIAGRSTER